MMGFFEFLLNAMVARRARNETWNPGDIAVCVADRWTDQGEGHPKRDEYFTVSGVCVGGLWLHFEGKPPEIHYEASAFRKVVRDTAPAQDEIWVEQLKHLRKREPA